MADAGNNGKSIDIGFMSDPESDADLALDDGELDVEQWLDRTGSSLSSKLSSRGGSTRTIDRKAINEGILAELAEETAIRTVQKVMVVSLAIVSLGPTARGTDTPQGDWRHATDINKRRSRSGLNPADSNSELHSESPLSEGEALTSFLNIPEDEKALDSVDSFVDEVDDFVDEVDDFFDELNEFESEPDLELTFKMSKGKRQSPTKQEGSPTRSRILSSPEMKEKAKKAIEIAEAQADAWLSNSHGYHLMSYPRWYASSSPSRIPKRTSNSNGECGSFTVSRKGSRIPALSPKRPQVPLQFRPHQQKKSDVTVSPTRQSRRLSSGSSACGTSPKSLSPPKSRSSGNISRKCRSGTHTKKDSTEIQQSSIGRRGTYNKRSVTSRTINTGSDRKASSDSHESPEPKDVTFEDTLCRRIYDLGLHTTPEGGAADVANNIIMDVKKKLTEMQAILTEKDEEVQNLKDQNRVLRMEMQILNKECTSLKEMVGSDRLINWVMESIQHCGISPDELYSLDGEHVTWTDVVLSLNQRWQGSHEHLLNT